MVHTFGHYPHDWATVATRVVRRDPHLVCDLLRGCKHLDDARVPCNLSHSDILCRHTSALRMFCAHSFGSHTFGYSDVWSPLVCSPRVRTPLVWSPRCAHCTLLAFRSFGCRMFLSRRVWETNVRCTGGWVKKYARSDFDKRSVCKRFRRRSFGHQTCETQPFAGRMCGKKTSAART